jgi:drug/metabolite transporter (DMT)-like permease
MSTHIGEIAAMLTAFFWTITALSVESASRRVGSIVVNAIRLPLAFAFISIFSWFHRGMMFPADASAHSWFWLTLSGLVGFVFGDIFLFRAYALISSRASMLIMTLVPPITAVTGWLALGETMSPVKILGMLLTISGIALVIVNRDGGSGSFSISLPLKGVLYALLGALGQAFGLILSKYGMGDYDAFASTQIRIIAGAVGFTAVVFIFNRAASVRAALTNRPALLRIALGSFFGPFLGVSFSLYAVQHTATGIASTIMATVPILIIPPSALLFKQRITPKDIAGAVISVCGVVLFFV